MRLASIAVACALLLAAAGGADGARVRSFVPTEIGFWNARDGVALFGRPNCYEPAICTAIGRTSDGGRRWTLRAGPLPLTHLVVAPGGSAWAQIPAEVSTRCTPLPPGPRCEFAQTLRSRDRGRTWEATDRGTCVRTWCTVPSTVLVASFPTPRDGFGFRGSTLVRTHDAGRTWSAARNPCDPGWPPATSFVTPTRGWILCAREPDGTPQPQALFRTDDGGRHWTLVMDAGYVHPDRLSNGAVYPGRFASGISFARGGAGLLWQSGGLTYHTRDGGRTWTHVAFTASGFSIDGGPGTQLSARTAFLLVHTRAAGRVELRRTDDGGTNWRIVRSWSTR